MKQKCLILTILILLCLTFRSPEAQIIFGQRGYFSSGLIYTGWNIKDTEETEINELVGVMRIFLPVSDNLELSLLSTGAAADLTYSSVPKKKLSSLNDTRIQGAYSFADDTFLLTLGLNLPTGKKSLTADEIEITDMLADNSMRFPVRRYGEGLDVSFGLAAAQEMGGVILGLGGGYLLKGEYTPFSSKSDEYKPGDELTLSLGIDAKGAKTLLRLDGIHTRFMREKFGGEEIFQKGNMYEIGALLAFTGEKTSLGVNIEAILREKNLRVSETGFSYEENNSYGNEYRADFDLRHALSNSFSTRWLFEIRALAANQYPEASPFFKDKSMYYGGGTGFNLQISESVGLNLAGKYFMGKTDGDNKDLTGVNAEAGITFGF